MRRWMAGILLFVFLAVGSGCAEKADLPVPPKGDYQVTANGRVYTTAGCPFRYDTTVENRGYLDYRTNLVGTVGEDLTGTFPEGTALYGLKGGKNKNLLMAVIKESEEVQHCYLVTSFDSTPVTQGRTIADAIGFNNSFAGLYRYTADGSGWIVLPVTSGELMDLGTAYSEGGLLEPSGKSVELVAENFSGDYAVMTLYENGALVYAGCPQYAIDLGEDVASVLWGYLAK